MKRAWIIPYSLACCSVIFGSHASAADTTTQGSALTHRTQVDANGGQVYIYAGGAFPINTQPVTFDYLFDFAGPSGTATGYITPLLFVRQIRDNYVLYAVAGIGKSFHVKLNSEPQRLPFDIIAGTKVTSNATFTFGYVNAIVNASGSELAQSNGTVDMDNPADGGDGVGGPGTTNDWSVTNIGGIVLALGTTFGPLGSTSDFPFYGSSRTYSAQASGIVR